MFKRILMLGPAALLAAACGSERPHPTDPTVAFSAVETSAVRENTTVQWNAIARAQTLTHAMSQQAGVRLFAYLSLAQANAAAAADDGVSVSAAIAGASAAVLASFFPDQVAYFDAQVGQAPDDDEGFAAGVALGRSVGADVLARARSDSRPDVLAPSPQLAVSAAVVPVYNFSAPFGVRVNAVNTGLPEHEASFTQDGHTMYFRCDDPSDPRRGNDICVSRLLGTFEDGRWTDPERLPYPINTEFGDHEPKISRNGKRLFFQSDRLEPGDLDGRRDFDVYYSDLVGGEWQAPVRLPAPINTEFNDHCVYFEDTRAYDDLDLETDVYLASNRPGIFPTTPPNNDLWVSHRKNGVYSEPVNLGPNINSPFSDHMAMVGPDGRLWVTTTDPNRPGALGGEDMYLSTRQADGSWGPLVNMGPSFNTAKDDRCADFVMSTGQGGTRRDHEANTHAKGNVIYAVYASTDRQGGMGNRDLWYFRVDDLLRAERE